MEYGTVKLPREAYKRHNERRKELGVTWAEYVDGEAPEPMDTDALAAQLADDLRAELPDAVAEEVARRFQ